MNGARKCCLCNWSVWLYCIMARQAFTIRRKQKTYFSLDRGKDRLRLFKANLLDEGSFDPVVDGCDGVFHTASPVLFSSITDPQAELIDPAVKGTLNVLNSCKKIPTVKRVILTFSMASVIMNRKPLTPDVVVDETWYSDPLIAERHKLWYLLSKTLAEEAAWKFAEGNGIDLVSINPGFVIGPLLQSAINLTVEMIQNLITGKAVPASNYRLIDVRDVASAHVKAFEVPSASGRYCFVSHVVHISEALKITRQLYPCLHIPERCQDDNPLLLPSDPQYQVSMEKAKGLGISFYPLEVTLKDTIESLQVKGYLNI